MLSINKCRDLLGNESQSLTDKEIEVLRDQFYSLATLMILNNQRAGMGREGTETGNYKTALDMLPESDKISIEERASVIEYDGKLSRQDAERAAVSQVLEDWSN